MESTVNQCLGGGPKCLFWERSSPNPKVFIETFELFNNKNRLSTENLGMNMFFKISSSDVKLAQKKAAKTQETLPETNIDNHR